MRLALDADVCIYAVNETPWTQAVRRAITEADELVGSVLLPAEVLTGVTVNGGRMRDQLS